MVRVGGDKIAGYDKSKLNKNEFDNGEVDGGKVGDDKVGKKSQNLFKSKNLSKSKKTVKSDFFILGARLAFTKLRQAFVKVPILYHFNLERHI